MSPVATATPKRKNSATFINESDNEVGIRVTEGSRRGAFTVKWSCGDEYTIPRQTIESAVALFAKRGLPADTAFMLRRVPTRYSSAKGKYVPDMSATPVRFTFAVMKENGVLWLEDFSVGLNWKSFLDAWKALNN